MKDTLFSRKHVLIIIIKAYAFLFLTFKERMCPLACQKT